MSHIKYPLNAKSSTIENQCISGFKEDAIRVWGSNNSILFNTIDDSLGNDKHHRDAIQLIPTGNDVNSQMFGAIAQNNLIQGNQITSLHFLQMIFQSDGVQENLVIKDNILGTYGSHFITICGMLSGEIKNNRTEAGEHCPVVLESLRIGGGLANAFYALSFSDGRSYEPINTDQKIQDYRKSRHRKGANYILRFNLGLFRNISELRADQYKSISQHFNDTVTEYEHHTGENLRQPNYEVSAEGLTALIESEGYRDRIYQDSKGLDTIGVGHLITNEELLRQSIYLSDGSEIEIYSTLTEKQVMQLLQDDLYRFKYSVNKLKQFLNQGQFDALVSFAFNIGVSGFEGSTAFKRVLDKRHYDVPKAMLMWNKPPISRFSFASSIITLLSYNLTIFCANTDNASNSERHTNNKIGLFTLATLFTRVYLDCFFPDSLGLSSVFYFIS